MRKAGSRLKKGLMAACLSVGLATTWGVGAAQALPTDIEVDFSGTLEPAVTAVENVYLLYGWGTSASLEEPAQAIHVGGYFDPGVKTPFDAIGYVGSSTADLYFTIVGLYDVAPEAADVGAISAGGVAIGSPHDNIGEGNSWEDVFGSSGVSEGELYDAIAAGDTDTILDWWAPDDYVEWAPTFSLWMGDIGDLSDVTGDLTIFSDAVPNGTVYFRQFDGGTVIPEPATLVLFGAGAAPLVFRLLRRKKN